MNVFQTFLQFLAAFLISPTSPPADSAWKTVKEWKQEGKLLVFAAESSAIIEECRKSPARNVESPILLQGGHEYLLDGESLISSAHRDFEVTPNFYNYVTIPCSEIASGKVFRWEAYTQTHSLAKLNSFPVVKTSNWVSRFLRETANIMIAGTLIGLGVVCFLIFYGKVGNEILLSLLAICLFDATTFACFVPGVFNLGFRQNFVQSLSDICLWAGLGATGRVFYLLGYSSKAMYRVLYLGCGTGIVTILLSYNLDQNQVGSTISFLCGYVFLFSTLFGKNLLGRASGRGGRNSSLKTLAVLVFILTGVNDMFMGQWVTNSEPLVPFGVFCCTALLALAVNDKVVETYNERDYLRRNLEKEVETKTEALRKKSDELETALTSLKIAQADLVQSAKLVSLGTLSAGIAHEINNALNYVNGSITPLGNILKKDPLTEADRNKAAKLLELMKEGLGLTFAIILNLKRNTNESAGQLEMLTVQEVVDGTLLILKNALTGFSVTTEIDPSLKVTTSRASLSQILINLINNSIDAVTDANLKGNSVPKHIHISAKSTEDGVNIEVEDSGPGVPAELRERIFDPFFTTKPIGKGTGLGLHIVLSEMKKQGGMVTLESNPGKGAKFVVHFPKHATERAAA